MSVTDPIADMLNRIRNAYAAGHEVAEVPHSQLKAEVARILTREGYVRDVVVEGEGGRKTLRVYLKYGGDREPAMKGLKRVSSPGFRRYAGVAKLPRVLGGLGVTIVSTSAGVMTDREARRRRVGGEVLCQVW